MTRWEYQVVRINVEPTVNDTKTAQKTDSEPVFSETYLKQEFPAYYAPPPASATAGSDRPSDPALKLQAFLNSQGEDSWEAIGIQKAGPHTFIILKRPKASDKETSGQPSSDQLKLTLELATKCLDLMNKQAQKDQGRSS